MGERQSSRRFATDRAAGTIGLAIFLAPSDAKAAEIMNADPAVKQGVMSATLYPYEIAFGRLKRP